LLTITSFLRLPEFYLAGSSSSFKHICDCSMCIGSIFLVGTLKVYSVYKHNSLNSYCFKFIEFSWISYAFSACSNAQLRMSASLKNLVA
jgi:hypothetical protein